MIRNMGIDTDDIWQTWYLTNMIFDKHDIWQRWYLTNMIFGKDDIMTTIKTITWTQRFHQQAGQTPMPRQSPEQTKS